MGHLPAAPRSAATRGTVELWKSEIASKCADNPVEVLAVSLTFVGPLLSLSDWHGGGIHLHGPSSCGKRRSKQSGATLPERRWRVACLSTGQISLSEKLAEIGRTTLHGQEVRLADGSA